MSTQLLVYTNSKAQLNKPYYETKRKIRTKVVRLFKNANCGHCDEFIGRTEIFNRKLINSIDDTIENEVKKSKIFSINKSDRINEMSKIYVEMKNVFIYNISP
jgi:hypothetical protein